MEDVGTMWRSEIILKNANYINIVIRRSNFGAFGNFPPNFNTSFFSENGQGN